MAESKISISLNEHTVGILAKANEMWPELSGSQSVIIRKIIADWDRLRENGGRSERMERKVEADGDQTRREIVELRERMASMEQIIVALAAAVARLEARQA